MRGSKIMSNLNKLQIIGRVGKSPIVRYTKDNKPIASLSLAVSEKFKNKSGEQVESTEWINVVFFGKLAEIVEKYVDKGSLIYVEGKFKTRKWTDKDGNDKYSTECVVDGFSGSMQMLGGKSDNPKPQAPAKPQESNEEAAFDDDCPF